MQVSVIACRNAIVDRYSRVVLDLVSTPLILVVGDTPMSLKPITGTVCREEVREANIATIMREEDVRLNLGVITDVHDESPSTNEERTL